ncbi:MAG: DEAD/DEAH box helicase [Bdellovibrionaceae bacterium]|nr:DEAD/DEAH box helicase [Pseudobdellovibrionaceae bacterium]
MINSLCSQIWKNQTFQSTYENILENHLKFNLWGQENKLDEQTYTKLVQVALHFAMSTNHDHKLAAFKIAIALYNAKGFEKSDLIKAILARLGNFPSVSSFFGDFKYSSISMSFWTELESHYQRNTVKVMQGTTVTFTDFQRTLWERMKENDSLLTVTAPTSAGKSFSLKMFLLNQLSSVEQGIFVYTVPSRALISQITDDLRPELQGRFGSDAIITGAPTPPAELKKKKIVYVLTQERLQNLLEVAVNLQISYMFVDEAQTIADDSRGILLQNVIEKILGQTTDQKIFFGSPFLKNPEIFHKIFRSNNQNVIKETESPVVQNLISCKLVGDQFQLELILKNRVASLGSAKSINKSQSNKSNSEILATTCHSLSSGSASIIYAGGPASCEEIAESLAGFEVQPEKLDPVIEDFSKFLKTHIHKSYTLSEVIKSGVGFHYGRMPSVIRKSVEDLFSDGYLKQIVCTSTLLHGVNLPAKNLFIRKPTKGRDRLTGQDKPLNSSDFWNLAGRAGRLGKEFEGNVFLVDYDEWEEKPLSGDREHVVDSSLYNTIQRTPDELSDFIADHDHASGVNDKLEATFMRLYTEKISGTLDSFLASRTGLSNAQLNKIQDNLTAVVSKLSIPSELAQKNPTISVLRQEDLFKYFENRITDLESAEDCIPKHPKAANSYRSILRVFNRIHKHLQKLPTTNRRPLFFAPFAIDWMNGSPLAMLIGKRIDYLKKESGSDPNVASTIREVMTIVETDLRFRYVNFTKCHNDILEYVLIKSGFESITAKIPALPLYLEFGASSETMINLIGMGLSRSTASILELHLSPQMSVEELSTWLRLNKWKNINLPLVCYREISKNLGVI